jgi:hypothetical protein
MPTFDFSSPFVVSRIIDHDGNAYPFWVDVGETLQDHPTLPGGEELQAMAFVQQVQVSLDLSGIPKISAQLSPPFREGMAFINSHLANSAGQNKLEVQFGYSAGTSDGRSVRSPVYTGMLLQPEIQIDVDIQITLNTEGVGPTSAANQVGQAVAEEGQTRRQVMRAIAEHGGRNLNLDFEDADTNDVCRQLLDASTNYVQGNRTDWMALWELATSCRCWLSFVGETLYVLSRVNRWRANPVRRYRLFDYPGGRVTGATLDALVGNLSESELPILSFSNSTPAVWLPQNQFGVRLTDVGEHTRTMNERVLTPANLTFPAAGQEGSEIIEGNENVPANVDTRPGDPNDSEAVNTVTEEMGNGANLGVQVEIETLGDPDIVPAALVRLAGLGRRFDNRVYMVHKVSHSIGNSGFTTNLTLITNLDSVTNVMEGGVPPAGTPNTGEVQENADEYEARPTLQGET